jgi:MoaA/NifB/PqqE/SkfB family radical SAM enzyme
VSLSSSGTPEVNSDVPIDRDRVAMARAGRKAGLLRAYLRRRPLWCSWQLTRRCESYCMFCEHRLEGAEAELDLAGCERVAAQLSRLGSLMVSLTGGEPFLRSDLPDVVRLLAGRHFPFLTTHGWLVTPARARAVWSAGLEAASVRLDHADAEAHDRAAGLPGAHTRALAALAVLSGERVRKGQRVNVQVRLTEGDSTPLEGLLEIAARHEASVTVEPAFPAPGSRASGLSQRLIALRRRHAHLRGGAFHLARMDEALAGGVSGCQAGRAFFNIDHRGRVSKCVEFQGPADRAGSLAEGDADQVLRSLQDLCRDNPCRSCWSAYRGEVEGLYSLRGLVTALPELVRS